MENLQVLVQRVLSFALSNLCDLVPLIFRTSCESDLSLLSFLPLPGFPAPR